MSYGSTIVRFYRTAGGWAVAQYRNVGSRAAANARSPGGYSVLLRRRYFKYEDRASAERCRDRWEAA